jgi:Holliday junction resolvase RusA-like endonuclease
MGIYGYNTGMDKIFTFILSRIPPPKKNRYKIGKKRLFHNKEVQRGINQCTETIKEQWGGRATLMDPVRVDTMIIKPYNRPDDVNILETIYDCLEAAGVYHNDKQARAGFFFSIIDKEVPEQIIITLKTIDWEALWKKKESLQNGTRPMSG